MRRPVIAEVAKDPERLLAVGRLDAAEAGPRQELDQHRPDLLVVVDDQGRPLA